MIAAQNGTANVVDSRVTQNAQRMSSTAVLGTVVVFIAIYVVAVLLLMETSTYDTWGGFLVGPILVLISLPILARQATREGDRSLFWLLIIALLVKLGGALVFQLVAYDLYDRNADAVGYHEYGAQLAERFRVGNYDTGYPSLTGVWFIQFLVGILYTVIGTTKFGGYLVFSWLGFWGLFLLYRAFTIAVPTGRARTYARLVFFLPSLAFWPSSIGKEAWMMLALGVASYGAARMLSGRTWRGLLVAGLGLWMAGLVRPHIAGLMGVGLAAAYLLRPSRPELRQLAPIAKMLSMTVVAVVAVVVVIRAERFLSDSGVETEQGVAGAQSSIASQTTKGGSYFAPSILRSPTQTPNAVLAVLFRPLPHEARNFQVLASSLENTFLLLFTLVRVPWALAALKNVRRHPYFALALTYTALFIVAFSSLGNFGHLVRQRVQVLPFLIVLLCIPPKPQESSSASSAANLPLSQGVS